MEPGSNPRVALGFVAGTGISFAILAGPAIAAFPTAWFIVSAVAIAFAFVPLLALVVLFALLKSRGWLRPWWAIVSGAAACAASYFMFAIFMSPGGMDMNRTIQSLGLPIAAGAASGLVGWVLAFGLRLRAPAGK